MPEPAAVEEAVEAAEEMELVQVPVLKCEICDKRFASAQGLGAHRQSHTKVPCDGCGKEFPKNTIGVHRKACLKASMTDGRTRSVAASYKHRRVRCKHCHKLMARSSIRKHVIEACPVVQYELAHGQLQAESVSAANRDWEIHVLEAGRAATYEAPAITPVTTNGGNVHVLTGGLPVSALNKREQESLDIKAVVPTDDSTTDEVLVVLELLHPTGIAVHQLPAVMAWVETTKELLRKLQD